MNQKTCMNLLTIAIPTFNRAQSLKETLDSVVCQYMDAVEILISDNASTDSTKELITEYIHKYPFLKYYKNDKNIGGSLNFLECYYKASGKYVLLLSDDDILCMGAVGHIIEFLSKGNDFSLVFLNHVFFRDHFENIEKCTSPYLSIKKDSIYCNKNEFIACAGMRLTFLSALVMSKEKVLEIENPQQYKSTSFIQTCLALLSTKEPNSVMGIVAYPCVAANLPTVNISYNGFRLFGENVKNILTEVGSQAGYDQAVLNKIYKDYVLIADIKEIANRRICASPALWKDFRECVWPAIREYKGIRVLLVLAMCVPGFLWKPVKKYYSKRKYSK